MQILFFGRLADSFGRSLEVDAPPGTSIGNLRALLARQFPDAAPLPSASVRANIGDLIVGDDHVPVADEEVEFWPPVSGG